MVWCPAERLSIRVKRSDWLCAWNLAVPMLLGLHQRRAACLDKWQLAACYQQG